MQNEQLVLDVEVDDDDSYWIIGLYNVGYGYNKGQQNVYKVKNLIWESGIQNGDQTLYTVPIEFTGKYYLKMEANATWLLTAYITLTKPQTVPEATYACGSHYSDYQICLQNPYE